ncbi:MAG: OmpA family protein, partial [Bacteroidia bacterium]|nr:OmpA family protein [Bacteroidia bacterium]
MRTTLPACLLILVFGSIRTCGQTLSASVFFESNRASLSPAETDKLVRFLYFPDTVQVSGLSIAGYCDDRGSDAYNKKLSLERAAFIKDMILSKNAAWTIEAEGKGELALSKSTEVDAERGKNRRADIRVTYTIKQKTPAPKPLEASAAVEEKKASKARPDVTDTNVEKKKPIISDDQKVGDKITLENILFSGGRHILLPESYESLENLKNLLLEKKKYHIMILGHICCITSGEDGMDFDTGIKNLSIARAKAVYNYLVQNGVSPDRLSYKGMRANYPTGKSDREDRRVEIE